MRLNGTGHEASLGRMEVTLPVGPYSFGEQPDAEGSSVEKTAGLGTRKRQAGEVDRWPSSRTRSGEGKVCYALQKDKCIFLFKSQNLHEKIRAGNRHL